MNLPNPQADPRRAQQYWRDRLPAARIAWYRLSMDELIRSEGRVDQLAALVEDRYGVLREEAAHQVDSFFRRHALVP